LIIVGLRGSHEYWKHTTLKFINKELKFLNNAALKLMPMLLRANPQGLRPQVIAKDTGCLREITKKRLLMYLDELVWSGEVIYDRRTDTYRIRDLPPKRRKKEENKK